MLQSAMSSTRVCTAFIKRIQSLSYVPFHPRNVHCFLKTLLKDFFLLRFKSNTINCGLNYQKKITHLWICWYHIPFLTYASTLLKLHTLWFIAMSSSNPLWASNYLGVALARAPPCLMQFIRASSNVLKSRLQSDKPLSTSCNWTPTCCLDFFVLEYDHFLKGLLWNISSYVFI